MNTEESRTFMPVDVGNYDEAIKAADHILPPGEYKVEITGWQHGQGEKAQYIGWQLRTLDCPDPVDNDTSLFYITPIEGRGFRMFTNFVRALGQRWEGNMVTPEFCDNLVGLELAVETSIETWQDEDRAKVKKPIGAVNSI